MRDLVAPHVKLMAGPDGVVGTHLLSHFLKTLIGAGLQPAFDIVDRMAKAATAAGDMEPETATIADGCVIFSPHADIHHRCIAIQDDKVGCLFALELDNKVDADAIKFERTMAEILKQDFDEAEFRRTQLAKDAVPKEIRVYSYTPGRKGTSPGSLGEAIQNVISGGYSTRLLASVSKGFEFRSDDEAAYWSEGHVNLHRLDWQDPFRLLRKAAEAHGLLADWHALSDQVANRRYRTREKDPSLSHFDAADEFARETAAQDRHLLGARTESVLQAIQDISATAEVKAFTGEAMRILELCHERGHTSRETSFDHNDDDHYVYAHRLTPNRVVLVAGDHNREFALLLSYEGDAKSVTRAATFGRGTAIGLDQAIRELIAGERTENLIGSFEHRNGELTCVFGHTTETESVRSWNSLVSTIGSAVCCLEEEYRPQQRAPEMAP